MRCPNCDSNIADGSVMCPICGKMTISITPAAEEVFPQVTDDDVAAASDAIASATAEAVAEEEALAAAVASVAASAETVALEAAETEAVREDEVETEAESAREGEAAELEPESELEVAPAEEADVVVTEPVADPDEVEAPEPVESAEPEAAEIEDVEDAEDAEDAPEDAESKSAHNPYADADDMSAPIPAAKVSNRKDGKKKSRRGWVVALVGLALTGLAAGAGIMSGQMRANEAARYEEAHRHSRVVVDLQVPDTGDDKLSYIPIKVEGTDVDDETVDNYVLLTPEKRSFEILPGEYTLAPGGMAVTDSGRVYASSSTEVKIACEPDQMAEPEGTSVPSFSYAEVPLDTLTDEQIADIRAWMEAAELDSGKIDTYMKAIEDARATHLEDLKAQEEAAKKAEEEKKAAEEEEKRKKERDDALAENPEYITVNSVDDATRFKLTGTLRKEDHFSSEYYDPFTAYYIVLPTPVTFDCEMGVAGTFHDVSICEIEKLPYLDTDDVLESYLGQVISVEGMVFSTQMPEEHLGYAGLQDITLIAAYGMPD